MKLLSKLQAASLLSFALSQVANAKVILHVKEKGSGRVVRRATVVAGDKRVFADKEGRVELDLSQQTKPVKLTISRSGYEDTSLLFDNDDSEQNVFLVSTRKKTVIVVTGQNEITASKKQVSIDEAKRVAPNGDPANVVKLMPGVQVRQGFTGGRPASVNAFQGNVSSAASVRSSGGNANGRYVGPPSAASNAGIVVRGSPPEDSRFFIDDFEIPLVYHNIVDLSVVPGSLLSDVQFYAGGFSSRYGNAGGGIIRLSTKSDIPENDVLEGVVNLPYYSGIFYRGRLSDTSALSASYRRSYVDLFINTILERQAKKSGFGSFSISPVGQDAHAMFTQKTDDGVRKILLLYAEDGLKAGFTRNFSKGSDFSLSIDAYTRGLTGGFEQEGKLFGDGSYRTSPQMEYARTFASISDNDTVLNAYKLRSPSEVDIPVKEKTTLTLGVDPEVTWYVQKTDFTALPFFGVGNLDIHQDKHFFVASPALWGSLNLQLGPVTLVPGIRSYYNSQLKKASADVRGNATYALDAVHSLKLAVGKFSRAPTFDQASSEYGNPQLSYERTYHYVLGLESKWNADYNTEVQAYLKETYGVVESERVKKFLNAGRREAWGIELFARHNLTENFFGWVTYTYSKTIEQQAPGELFIRSPLDQTHVANVAVSYRLNPYWEVAGRYKYNTSGTYLPSRGGVYDTLRDRYSPQNQSAESDLPAQQSTTIYATKEFLMDTWKLSLKFGMESLWFKNNVTSMRANYEFSKDTPVTSPSNIPFLEVQGVL